MHTDPCGADANLGNLGVNIRAARHIAGRESRSQWRSQRLRDEPRADSLAVRASEHAFGGALSYWTTGAATWVTASARADHYHVPMVRITIERRWDGYTFLVNGRDDVVADPVWGTTTYDTEDAALEAARLAVKALQRAGTRRAALS